MSAPTEEPGYLLSAAKLHVFDTDSLVAENVSHLVIETANEAIKSNGIFTVGVSGLIF